MALAPDGTVIHLLGPASADQRHRPDRDRRRLLADRAGGDAPDEPELSIAADGTIYVASAERAPDVLGPSPRLDAIGPDGQIRWTHRPPQQGRAYRPAIGRDGTIYRSTWLAGSALTALNRAGEPRWRLALAEASRAAVGGDGTIYVVDAGFSTDGTLLAVRPDGRVRWAHPSGLGDPVIGPDGTLYAGGLALAGAQGPPRVTSLRASPARFSLISTDDCATARCRALATGTRLSFTLSRAADVDVLVGRPGRPRVVARFVRTAAGPSNTCHGNSSYRSRANPAPTCSPSRPAPGCFARPRCRPVATYRRCARGRPVPEAASRAPWSRGPTCSSRAGTPRRAECHITMISAMCPAARARRASRVTSRHPSASARAT